MLTNDEKMEIRQWAKGMKERYEREEFEEFNDDHVDVLSELNDIVKGQGDISPRALTDEEYYEAEKWSEMNRALSPDNEHFKGCWKDLFKMHEKLKKQAARKPKTVRDFEMRLRGMGFSQAEAKTIISKGFHPKK
jgi:hypothetical protein